MIRQQLGRIVQVNPDDPNRWWVRFVFGHVFVVLVWIGVGLIVTDDVDHRFTNPPPPIPKPGQPRVHPESSLGVIHHYIALPWPAVGVIFLALAALTLHPRTRPLAYFLGALIATLFTLVVVAYTYLSGNSTNQIVVPLATLAPDALIAGFRYAILPPAGAFPRRKPQ